MAATASMTLFAVFCVTTLYITQTVGQTLDLPDLPNSGLCTSMFCNNGTMLKKMQNCVVIVGDLYITRMEWWKRENANMTKLSFPLLREVTGFMLVYHVDRLVSIGRLFPNLARIRGETLLSDFALVVNDNDSLREVGLFGLIKIDRGGVAIIGNSHTCYTDTIDWKALAPGARHVIRSANRESHCKKLCTCSADVSANRCWNLKKCQRFIEGPKAEKCHPECLGCRDKNPNQCSLCRNYTYRGQCVAKCHNDTILLPSNKYCITEQDCKSLNGWKFNNSCVLECPVEYVKRNFSGVVSCERCLNCQETCRNQTILNLETIQKLERCVYINGSLIIHLRAAYDVMKELNKYLGRIQEVEEYIVINGSTRITSLNFFKSLRRIGGRNLTGELHSLVIEDMPNLQTLFLPSVLENLKVDRGHLLIKNNPMLCMNDDVNKLISRFPVHDVELDVPFGFNGYTAECKETYIDVKVTVVNETSALVRFIASRVDPEDSSTVLYTRLIPTVTGTIVPESCSKSEWISKPITNRLRNYGLIDLLDLEPASTYAVCIETFNNKYRTLTRTKIANFTTKVGKPEPPFIVALTALSSDTATIRWVDHQHYKNHIRYYKLDISLIEIETKDVLIRDHCKKIDDVYKHEPHRHFKIMRPPLYYKRGCESLCGHSPPKISNVRDEYFDVCSSLEQGCDTYDEENFYSPRNESFKNFVKSLFLNISAPKTGFNVTGLAPFSDYRFRLRSCTNNLCSRSVRSVVRTFALNNEIADKPLLLSGSSIQPGYVSVHWKHPHVSNGPVLSYFIEVFVNEVPSADVPRQVWCVPSNITNVHILPELSYKYIIKVCSTTLAFTYACSNTIEIEIDVVNTSMWWIGVIFGIFLYLISFAIGFLWKSRVHNYLQEENDDIPLVDCTSLYRNESDPPVVLSDFTPLYLLQLGDPD